MNIVPLLLWHLGLCLSAIASEDVTASRLDSPPAFDLESDEGQRGYYPTWSYATEEDLNGPITNFVQWDSRCNDGLFTMLTPRGWGLTTPGPMILDGRGHLVWAKHFSNKFGGQAYDLMVQTYQGQDYLTFWLGDDRVRGHGSGFYYMLNASYDIVHRVGAANGLSADLHEFLITPEGTALMTMYQVREYDITDFPDYHPDEERPGQSFIWDCVFQEISIETGELVYEWRASDHVKITDTYRGIGPGGSKHDPFDWYHMNSIEKDELGNYLVSARYTHSITYVNGQTGEIIWTLGGKHNDFLDMSDGNAINFAWQHDARFLPTDTFPNMYSPPDERDGYTTKLLTLFDNAAEDQHYEYGLPISRALLLEVTYPVQRSDVSDPDRGNPVQHAQQDDVDLNTLKVMETNGTNPEYTVRVVKSYENPQGVRSSSQGSMQVLPQGPGQDPKVFVGYGLNAVWTEFEADGSVLCDVHYGATTSWERGDIQSYRTYKFPWVGTPETPPAVEISDDDAEIYVSWNGATEVADWVLQCSEKKVKDEHSWFDITKIQKTEFETIIPVPDEVGESRYLRVIALDRSGRRIPHGTSKITDRGVLAAYGFPAWTGKFPHEIISMTPLKTGLVLVGTVIAIFILFGAYRRFLSWRTGRSHAGPLRWRKGAAYRLLGDA